MNRLASDPPLNEVRWAARRFVDYYAAQGYRALPGSSLLHASTPMSFVMSAGMVQFEELSQQLRSGDRFVLVQNCFRYFDLARIGAAPFHLSLFQMPGAFTFGPVDRPAAIAQLWDLLTEGYGFDPTRLAVTYFAGGRLNGQPLPPDEETRRAWLEMGMPAARLHGMGLAENFWKQSAAFIGETNSPKCGAHTEVFYDRGPERACGPTCHPGCPCSRFIEISNVLFIDRFHQPDQKRLLPLDEPFTETVIGLERLAALRRGLDSVYALHDLRTLVEQARSFTRAHPATLYSNEHYERILADHLRALLFLCADGAPPPGRGGRKRLMRQLLRRVFVSRRMLNIEDDGLLPVMVLLAADRFPEAAYGRSRLETYLEAEEPRFTQTVQKGLDKFDHWLQAHPGMVIEDGELHAFSTRSGVPLDLLYYALQRQAAAPVKPGAAPKWTARRIERSFCDFFHAQGYTRLPGGSLLDDSIPMSFVMSAGLVQVERAAARTHRPAQGDFTLVQNCFRHFDLERAGQSPTHLSLFRMAGAFTFGPPQRTERLRCVWRLLLDVYLLPSQALWITWFGGGKVDGNSLAPDFATRDAWLAAGVDPQRLLALGPDENFWRQSPLLMGPEHARKCGPNSEVFFDRGSHLACSPTCRPGCGCGRFVEFLNTLFIEWEWRGEQSPVRLDQPFTETVLGVERLAMILQAAATIYEIDNIRPILRRLRLLPRQNLLEGERRKSFEYLLADHLRALLFLHADGAPPPGKGGRAFIIRRLIREVITAKRLLGIEEHSSLASLAHTAADQYRSLHPGLATAPESLLRQIIEEEQRFDQALERGAHRLEVLLGRDPATPSLSPRQAEQITRNFGAPPELLDLMLKDWRARHPAAGKGAQMTTAKLYNVGKKIDDRLKQLLTFNRFYLLIIDPRTRKPTFSYLAPPAKPTRRHGVLPADTDELTPPRPPRGQRWLHDYLLESDEFLLIEEDFSAWLKERNLAWRAFGLPHAKTPCYWLGQPLKASDQVIGALIVESWSKTSPFDDEARRLLAMVARQAAAVIENIWLAARLRSKVDHLRTIYRFAQRAAYTVFETEQQVFEEVYNLANSLAFDTHNLSIAVYQPDPYKPDVYTPARPDRSQAFGTIQFVLVREDDHPVDPETDPRWKPRTADIGLTGYVIRTRRLYNPADVPAVFRKLHPDYQDEPVAKSWLGVPMLQESRILGVITLRSYDLTNAYTKDDAETLETLAGFAAAAINNLRLTREWRKEQEKTRAVDRIAAHSETAAEFAHKMNNLAGTIPARVEMAREALNPDDSKDQKVLRQLNFIEENIGVLLRAAQEVRLGTERSSPELIQWEGLIESAIRQAMASPTTQKDGVRVDPHIDGDLPALRTERNRLLDALMNLVRNALEATEGPGKVSIHIAPEKRDNQPWITVSVEDTGAGMLAETRQQLFQRGFTTKGNKGMGLGLWRTNDFIQALGGHIEVQSVPGKGSTFILHIPTGGV